MGAALSRRSFLASIGLTVLGVLAHPQRALAQAMEEVVPTVSYEMSSEISAERSWYASSFQFESIFETGNYYFDGNNIGIELNATVSSASGVSFVVTLYQGSRSRGSATLNASGFVRAEWTGVGPGSYSFRFTSTSGKMIVCTNVAMFSW